MAEWRGVCAILTIAAAMASAANAEDYWPGDRPSVCLERARGSIEPNLRAMTRIADTLRREDAFDAAGLMIMRDGSRALHVELSGASVDLSDKLQKNFLRLFDRLDVNLYTPWFFYQSADYVLAQPGDFFPGLFIINSGPWCGGTDAEWRAGGVDLASARAVSGGPIRYVYEPGGIQLETPCSDETFLTEEGGSCELRLNKDWLIIFTYMNTPATP